MRSISNEAVELQNLRTDHVLRLNRDHIHSYTSNPTPAADGVIRGYLKLTVQVVVEGVDVSIRPTTRPGEAIPNTALSPERCDELAALLSQARLCLDQLVRNRASTVSREALNEVQQQIHQWLGYYLGSAIAEAFLSAPPVQAVPDKFPFKYCGLYQVARGRLAYLQWITSEQCG